MALSVFLREAGYQQVALTRSAVGHFHTGGTLNGRRVDVLLDTGAASTVVSLAVARGHGITLNKLDLTGGGAGGANLEIHALVGAKLSLGEVQPRPRRYWRWT